MDSKIFVTATDTEAGKTWVTAASVTSLLANQIRATALKPIACGLNADGSHDDINALLAAQKLEHSDQISLYRYQLAAAPAQAAAAEQRVSDPGALVQWCKEKARQAEVCLIEGVGGLMVPITDNWLVSDWIEAMPEFDVWLVVGCKLGAINQSLLTLEKLKQMGRIPARIFFNAADSAHDIWIDRTVEAVRPFLPADCRISIVRHEQFPPHL